MGSIPGSGRSPGGGNGNPLQFSCLENPMDREAWQATVYGITKSQTLAEQLSTHTLCRTAGPCKSCSYSYSRVTSHGLGLVGWLVSGRAAGNLYLLGLLSLQSNVSNLTSRFMPVSFHLQRADLLAGAGWGPLPQGLCLTKFTAHPEALGGTRNLWRLSHSFPLTLELRCINPGNPSSVYLIPNPK